MQKTMKELIQLAMQNDQEALNALYQMTYNGVYRTVKTMIKDDDAALDVVQDSYVKGFQKLDTVHEPEKFASWMNQIAANTARDYFKKKHTATFTDVENENGEIAPITDDCLENLPEEVLDRKETARLVKEILDALPEDQRAAIFMFYYDQMSVKEIAETLNCSENTVKSRLKYGRTKIKTKVEELEKQGTKLYSLAPVPFLLWLLRMAKAQNISAAALCPTAETAIKAASVSAAAHTTQASTAKTVTGAAKAASKTAGKALAKKIVAGTLAVAIAGGAGVATYHARHKPDEALPAPLMEDMSGNLERRNEIAHLIFEKFLKQYGSALEMTPEEMTADCTRFWTEVDESIQKEHSDADPAKINSWYLDYCDGAEFENGLPVPDTIYAPQMNQQWLQSIRLEEETIQRAYQDINGDGVDELFIGRFYRGQLQTDRLDVYAIYNNALVRGAVDITDFEDHTEWECKTTEEADYVGNDIIYISMGKEVFASPITIAEPDLVWEEFCNYSGTTAEDEPTASVAPEPEMAEAPSAEPADNVIGETVSFGTFATYTVDNGGVMDDEDAVLQWIVLDTDGSKALLLSKYAYSLGVPYAIEDTETTWADSAVRSYLNGDFLSVFTPEQQAQIVPSTVSENTGDGGSTQDLVFLLSADEAAKYLPSLEERTASEKSLLGHGSGVIMVRPTGIDGQCSWWLRTLDSAGEKAAFVDENGTVNREGTPVNTTVDVRPAMWVDLSALDGVAAESTETAQRKS